MIITRLVGGLGNQMFQYAAGLALAQARRTVLKLDVSWFRRYEEYEEHNRYGLSCFNVTEQFATDDEIQSLRGAPMTHTEQWALKLAHTFRFRRYCSRYSTVGNWHRPPTFRFYSEFFDQPDNTYLDGMWQSEGFFEPARELIRLHFSFRYPPNCAVSEMAQRIKSGPSVAIHFRRGDYVRNTTFRNEIGIVGDDYYRRALELVRRSCPDVICYIFSDDIDTVERDFDPGGPHVFVRVTKPWHAFDKIRLIGLCDHAIIANSTFSWWGAWLNPSPNKIVVAPDPWFGGDRDGSDLVPGSWVRLARD